MKIIVELSGKEMRVFYNIKDFEITNPEAHQPIVQITKENETTIIPLIQIKEIIIDD